MRTLYTLLITACTAALATATYTLWRRLDQDDPTLDEEVDLTLSQKVQILWNANIAGESRLEALGVGPVQRNILLKERPVTSLHELTGLSGVGVGTLSSLCGEA